MSELRKRTVDNKSGKKKEEESIPEFKHHHEELPSAGDSLAMRIYSRVLVFTSLMVVVYFSFKEEKVLTFARQTDTLPGKGEIVQCSSEYLNQVDKYEGCGPKECKRFVTDEVVTREEAEKILELFKKVTPEISKFSGRISQSDLKKELISQSQKRDESGMLTECNNIYNAVKDKIKQSMVHHFGVDPRKIYLTEETYFSAMTSESPVSSSSLNEYHESVTEQANKKGIHYTTILYLGDFKKDFKGGRFVYLDYKVNKTVEPKRGRINMFTSGRENYNYVEKVNSGKRYAIAYSFSCDKNNAVNENNI